MQKAKNQYNAQVDDSIRKGGYPWHTQLPTTARLASLLVHITHIRNDC